MTDITEGLRASLAATQEREQRLAAQLARAEKIPTHDPYEDGQVIQFWRRFNIAGKSGQNWFLYVAQKAGDLWYLSGRRVSGAHPWSDFVKWFAEGNVLNVRKMDAGDLLLGDEPFAPPVAEHRDRTRSRGDGETVTVTRAELDQFFREFTARMNPSNDDWVQDLFGGGSGHGPAVVTFSTDETNCRIGVCRETWRRDAQRNWRTDRIGRVEEPKLDEHWNARLIREAAEAAKPEENKRCACGMLQGVRHDGCDDGPDYGDVDSCSVCGGYHAGDCDDEAGKCGACGEELHDGVCAPSTTSSYRDLDGDGG